MALQYAPVRKVYWNLSHQQKARSAYLPPGGRWASAARPDEKCGKQLQVCTGLELSGSARIPHPPLRGTLSPGEGIASYNLHALNNNLANKPIFRPAGVIPSQCLHWLRISKNQVPSCPMGIGYSETPHIEIAAPPMAACNDASSGQRQRTVPCLSLLLDFLILL